MITTNKSIIIYDKYNKQKDYQYMAKTIGEGRWVVGWVAIEQPWYSPESDWTYYILNNVKLGTSGQGFNKYIIAPNTIVPYTQSAQVRYDLDAGLSVRIDKEFFAFDEEAPPDNTIVTLIPGDKIPKLWSK